MNARAKALIASVVVIALALTAVSGVTYSWFSDTEKTDVSVDGAKFDLMTEFGTPTVVNSSIGTSATVDSTTGTITVSNLAPGSIVTIPYSAEYTSTIDVIYSLKATVSNMVLKDYDMENISVCGKSIKTIVGAGSSGDLALVDWISKSRTVPAATYGAYQPLDSGNIVINAPTTYGDTPDAGWSANDERSFTVVITAELTQGDRPVASLVSGSAVIPASNKTVSGPAEAEIGAAAMDATVDFSAVRSVTPASSSASVEPAGLTVSVKSVPAGTTGFSVNALRTISLTLSDSAGPISSPTFDQPVVVTAVLKEVTPDPGVVQVKYGTETIDVVSYMYDSSASTLTVVFKTDHFSDFDIVPAVATIGSKSYLSLEDAINDVCTGETIVLERDSKGNGVSVKEWSDFTIDFNSHTYTTVGPTLAGSTGTESQCFQLLKNSTIVFKNGSIVADNSNLKMIIQNYSNLTLDHMKLNANEGTNSVSYVLSNNNGTTSIIDSEITAKSASVGGYGPVAFDVCVFSIYDGPAVKVERSKIVGAIEFSVASGAIGHIQKLLLDSGDFTGASLKIDSLINTFEITKGVDVDLNAPCGYRWDNNKLVAAAE